jgi:2-polyprenyl-3-methyl-5-hydroxy-6-metoxy-1,4-benzoquinol methylase
MKNHALLEYTEHNIHRFLEDFFDEQGIPRNIYAHLKRFKKTLNLILPVLNTKESFKILDIGTGFGILPYLILKVFPHHTILAVDVEMSKTIQKRLEYYGVETENNIKIAPGKRLPFNASEFDVVLLIEVLEHVIDDPRHVLKEVARILRHEGTLVLTTPNLASIYNRLRLLMGKQPQLYLNGLVSKKAPRGHFREWTMPELNYLLRDWFLIQRSEFVDYTSKHGYLKLKNASFLYYPYALVVRVWPPFRNCIFIEAKKRD